MKASAGFTSRIGIPSIKLALAVVLATSGFAHIANSFLFLSSILDYDMAGPEMATLVAALLPFLQIAVALELITQAKSSEWQGLVWATILFAFYCFVQIFAYGRNLEISCGCFGAASERVGPSSLAWSIGGLVLSVAGAFLCRKVAGWQTTGRAEICGN